MIVSQNQVFVSSDMPNFRHMGGYRAADGNQTQGDMLFRSGWIDLTDSESKGRFDALGIEQIFDFRTEMERERQPLFLPPPHSPDVIGLDIGHGNMGHYLQQISNIPTEEVDCKREMTLMYSNLLVEAVPSIRRMFDRLLETGGRIMLMCSTGKDRTGVASALLLTALGVSKTQVFEDYMLSAEIYRGKEKQFAMRHGFDPELIDLSVLTDLYTVHEQYLEAAFNYALNKGGSIEDFLEQQFELTPATLSKLRATYTQ